MTTLIIQLTDKVKVVFNPNDHHDYTIDDIQELAGLLPVFITQAAHNADTTPDTMEAATVAEYGYPLPPMEGGTFSPDGAYHYPDDPALYPIMILTAQTVTIYIYEYGMIAFSKPNESTPATLYRMD